MKKSQEILGQAATILRKFITVCLEGVVQIWSESKVEENQSQIGERVSWRQATTRRAAGLHHIFQSLKAEEEDRVISTFSTLNRLRDDARRERRDGAGLQTNVSVAAAMHELFQDGTQRRATRLWRVHVVVQ